MEFRRAIDRLLPVISEWLECTSDETELSKLQFALGMVRQAEGFLEQGMLDASWLRLIGALDFLRMTPAGRDAGALRSEINALLG